MFETPPQPVRNNRRRWLIYTAALTVLLAAGVILYWTVMTIALVGALVLWLPAHFAIRYGRKHRERPGGPCPR